MRRYIRDFEHVISAGILTNHLKDIAQFIKKEVGSYAVVVEEPALIHT